MRHDAVFGVGKTQDLAGDLLDDVGIGKVGREQRHITLELGAHGLEALDLELQQGGALDQALSDLEAMPAMIA